jgi:DNA polymerase-3 subunit alpha/error-prone DNA polymerase
MALRVVGPDVNRSRVHYRGEGDDLVVGFMAIAKLTKTAQEAIVAERERRGVFVDAVDFSRRLGSRLSREDLISLVAAGAFDSLSGSASRAEQARALLLASAPSNRSAAGQDELFGAAAPVISRAARSGSTRSVAPPTSASRALTSAPKRTKDELWEEYAALGFLRNRHPLVFWSAQIMRIDRVRAVDIPLHVGSKIVLVGWPVTEKTVLTSDERVMDFVSFEDETALYETVLFPETYEKYRTLLFGRQPLLLLGVVADDQGALSVEVEKMRPIERSS